MMFSSLLLATSLLTDFLNPPPATRPWCYYWWVNGHVDRETISADLESMKELGFGGILLFDSRGYWDDDEHLRNPPAEVVWGSREWYDNVEFTLRECARLGLVFTMNASASGGKMNGFIDGKEYEVDIMEKAETVAHLDRVIGPLLRRCPELVGTTFTHLYSVSYEGSARKDANWRDIKDRFYDTMGEWAKAHGLRVYSESAGPWFNGGVGAFAGADQLELLRFNDFPQGEFWPLTENGGKDSGHANRNVRYFSRAVVLDARRNSKPIVSIEAFTHMHRHWTVDPAFLKPTADQAFADGVNRIVWHAFTCSPKRFGVPGIEYFAGSHINRNVTWQREARGFVRYLHRCQALLQRGSWVDDGEFAAVTTNYYGWGRFRRQEDAQFTWTHRRDGDTDYFFIAGEGRGTVTLPVEPGGRGIELWDPVTAGRRPAVADGARIVLDLPVGGSCFAVVGPGGGEPAPRRTEVGLHRRALGPWKVGFAYPAGVTATPPAPVEMEKLEDFTGRTDLRHFAGTAVYRTRFEVKAPGRYRLSLGRVPTGLARVVVNGRDCGTVWCAPWGCEVSEAVREGENELEIRYINNWCNRFVGDCGLPEAERVTRSNVRCWSCPREDDPGAWSEVRPTRFSGYCGNDPLQSSGLLGPVELEPVKELPAPERTFGYGPHHRQCVHLWLPRGQSPAAGWPLAVYIHGGSWTGGAAVDIGLSEHLEELLGRGIAVASVEYRFLGETGTVPPVAGVREDCAAAIRRILEAAPGLGLDRSRLGLVGGSAGGCMSLVLGLAEGNPLGVRVIAANYPQTTLDPAELKAWIPNQGAYGAHAFGLGWQEFESRREELLPVIGEFSPAALVRRTDPARAPKLILEYWPGSFPKAGEETVKDPVHSAQFGINFERRCRERGLDCRLLKGPCRDSWRLLGDALSTKGERE